GRECASGHDDVYLETDELRREVREPLGPPLCISVLDDDVLALDVAELAQPLTERAIGTGRSLLETTYPGDLPRLLCLNGERRERNADGEEGNEYRVTRTLHTGPPNRRAGQGQRDCGARLARPTRVVNRLDTALTTCRWAQMIPSPP